MHYGKAWSFSRKYRFQGLGTGTLISDSGEMTRILEESLDNVHDLGLDEILKCGS